MSLNKYKAYTSCPYCDAEIDKRGTAALKDDNIRMYKCGSSCIKSEKIYTKKCDTTYKGEL